jgi:trigger factor
MKAQVESISPVKVKLSVEIPAQEVGEEETRAYKELQRRALIPGFRKGKAPLPALKRIYEGQVKSDVMSRLVERSYGDALRQNEIVPVSDADIDLSDATEEGGVAFTAVVEVRPKVEPRGYTGLSFKKEKVDISETDVAARIETLRREHASLEPAPEGHLAEEGDMVIMDFEGTIDGAPFEGGTGEGRSIVLGSGMLLPGFEEGLKGVAAGEERSLQIEFPADYRATEVAGKSATFRVNVKELKVRRLPELDDDFAREAAKTETLAELKEKMHELIRAERRARVDEEFRERVVDALLEANPFEVPESLVRRQQTRALDGLRQDLSRRGLDMETMGLDKQELQENYRRGAERAVRWAFLLGALGRTEAIEVTDAEVEERLRAIASADGRPYAMIRGFFQEGDRLDSLKSSILEQKVIERVTSSSTIEEVSPEEMAQAGGAR